MIALPPTRTIDETSVGDRLPSFEKHFTAVDLMAYGAATWDWHRLHYDSDYARSRGLDRPVIDGQMYGAVFAQALSAWVGPAGFVEKLSVKYRSMAFAGDTLIVAGVVTAAVAKADHGLITVQQKLTLDEHTVADAEGVVRVPL